ncbi:Nef-associated protein [Acrasis kona]|uniref:Nef-associated protein n=1 Tax=Acrasis kona TaxID=1008807 RepID=A0AAW2ZN38_9EUKA
MSESTMLNEQVEVENNAVNGANNTNLIVKPIGIFESVFTRKNATPRQGALCTKSKGRLVLTPENCFGKFAQGHGLDGLQDFSHLWLIYHFHDNGDDYKQIRTKVRAPRLNGGKVGVFASRTPHRPNPIGLTLAKLEAVDMKEGVLHLSGMDLIDGTPVLDIKPFIPQYDTAGYFNSAHGGGVDVTPPNVSYPSWIEQPPVSPIEDITFTEQAIKQLEECCNDAKHPLKFYKDWHDVRDAILEVLRLDPRSTYRRKKCQDKIYYFHIDELNVSVDIKDDVETNKTKAIVTKVEIWQVVLDCLKNDSKE